MLNDEEIRFISFWEENRDRLKKSVFRLSLGLPLAIVMVLAIFGSLFFNMGWHKRAVMEFNVNSSMVLTILAAGILTFVFITVFTTRHKWDINETRYKELLAKRDREQKLST